MVCADSMPRVYISSFCHQDGSKREYSITDMQSNTYTFSFYMCMYAKTSLSSLMYLNDQKNNISVFIRAWEVQGVSLALCKLLPHFKNTVSWKRIHLFHAKMTGLSSNELQDNLHQDCFNC